MILSIAGHAERPSEGKGRDHRKEIKAAELPSV